MQTISDYTDAYSGVRVVVEVIEKKGRKNDYFLTVYDLATDEPLEIHSCFTNKAELWEYFKEEYVSEYKGDL